MKEEVSKRRHGDEITQVGSRRYSCSINLTFSQDLFLDVLGSTATKREAKAYLSRFSPQKASFQEKRQDKPNNKDIGVNLGSLYLPIRAVEENPTFSTEPRQPHHDKEAAQSIHAALVIIRNPQSISDEILGGIAHSLSQLIRLGLSCIVVVDPEDDDVPSRSQVLPNDCVQADRIVDLIDSYGGQGARRLDNIVGVESVTEQGSPSVKVQGDVHVTNPDLLLAPLRRGITPIIVPIGFESFSQRLKRVSANEVVLALTREFAGFQRRSFYQVGVQKAMETYGEAEKQVSLDRIIVLDPLGGIPSTDGYHNSHVFINLEQEYGAIKQDLVHRGLAFKNKSSPALGPLAQITASTSSINGTYIQAVERESCAKSDQQLEEVLKASSLSHSMDIQAHINNLDLMKHALALLPPSSSAFLTTPEAVANADAQPQNGSEGPRVRTRRYRNPLIHNLLTDKPVVSSSLPSKPSPDIQKDGTHGDLATPATFFKRGMPVGIIPDPLVHIWRPPSPSQPSISLSDPRIDLSRLVYLIEDSFGRKLDVAHYLDRIKDRIAGIIIAGEYEGGAVLTWETPPGFPPDDSSHMIPYLDKFAVLRRSQGAGGVADIVFKAMVRRCFPNGVCWRSRKSNPVNKWYFERAKGTWKIPDQNWTMFWTTEGVELDDAMFSKYEAVCRSVVPSWADHKDIVD